MAGFDNDVVFGANVDFSGGNPVSAKLISDGQLLIGSTALNAGNTHINVGQLTSPFGTVNIGYVSPNITLDVASGAFTWSDVSGAFSPVKENGYFITGTATGTLPAAPAQGDTIQFFVDHASQLLTIQASGVQIIRMGSLVSSAGGSWTNTLQGDACELVYRSSDTCWCCVDFVGTWTKT